MVAPKPAKTAASSKDSKDTTTAVAKKYTQENGFDIDRPFYIRSKMFFERVIGCPKGQYTQINR